MKQMNKMDFFKNKKLYTWMINAPYSVNNVSSEIKSKNYLTNYYNLGSINYINKGANYIVWSEDDSDKFESNFSDKPVSFYLQPLHSFS